MKFKKIIIYVNVMLIYVHNIDKYLKKILIFVYFMLIYVNITDRQTHQKGRLEPHKT